MGCDKSSCTERCPKELFLDRFALKYHRPIAGLSPDAGEKLKGYRWSGNIRELQNCIEKSVILSEGTMLTAKDIQVGDGRSVPAMTGSVTPGLTGGLRDNAEEERLVREAMDRAGGNISAAAKMLGVSRPTLYSKLKKYGL